MDSSHSDVSFNPEEQERLRKLLLRVRAEATSDRNALRGLYGAYGSRIDLRLGVAEDVIEQANYFLEAMKHDEF